MRYTRAAITGTLIFTGLWAGGCTPQEKTPGALDRARTALEAKDFPAAGAAADEELATAGGSKRGRIQALYMKAQAIELRPKSSPTEATADLAQARTLYEQALAERPDEPTLSKVRAGLANVAYFQDDFTTAMSNWLASMDRLKNPDHRAWAVYRVGLCQQRLGRFDQADLTFEQVQRNYPNTEQSTRAKQHQGTQFFEVQVATFNKPEIADRLVEMIKAKGLTPAKRQDAQGRQVVSATKLPTYDAAKQAKAKVEGDYPDATIVP